jgi:tocopherol cyclase
MVNPLKTAERRAKSVGAQVARAYRRTGADVPFGNPLPSHGCAMEGWFWRVTDAAAGRVIVALFSVNRHPDGDWSTAAVALHPGDVVRAKALDNPRVGQSPFILAAGTNAKASFAASFDSLRLNLDDVHLDLSFTDSYDWPKAFAGGGIWSSVPFLNQYWHPYRLGGTATGTVEHPSGTWPLDDSKLYTERNWGTGFPDRWWWGQAHDFGDDDVSVAFSGGLLTLGPIQRDVGGVVVRLDGHVIRLTPPTAWVTSELTERRWSVNATSLRYQVELHGDGSDLDPHVLPVPLPGERRKVGTDFEHLAGRLHCVVRQFGLVIFDGRSDLAGLEVGSLPGFQRPDHL